MSYDFSSHVVRIRSLAVFSALRDDPVIGGLCRLMDEMTGNISSGKGNAASASTAYLAELYADVLSAMYPVTSDLSEYIRRAVLSDDNFYIEAIACREAVSDEVRDAVKRELSGLEELAALPCRQIRDLICETLPEWTNSPLHLMQEFADKLNSLSTTGYGIFAAHRFFRVSGSEIVPVIHPDVQPLDELFGYERQRSQIIRNTIALLEGGNASNILLYGDAGTGKSSTVKSVAFAYAERGLRLIEIKKGQLSLIPMILDEISRQSLRFILFIDDLSFSGNDDNFSALKAALEGSITGRGDNVVIYATSNRRHLIRESISDRSGDDLHLSDTLQETMSLAARFGLTVMFERPDKDEYLDIVMNLAELNGIDMPREELAARAEAHAIRRNGRSPRTAKQFVELLKIGLNS